MYLEIKLILFAVEPAADLHGSAEYFCPRRANLEAACLAGEPAPHSSPGCKALGCDVSRESFKKAGHASLAENA